MLYVTTRCNQDAFTVSAALSSSRGADGGMYLPFHFPEYDDKLTEFSTMPFSQCVAEILNRFFRCRLTGTDVEFTIGRSSCRLSSVGHRIAVAENFHNQQWDFDWVLRRLAAAVRGDDDYDAEAGGWLAIAIRIAILFGFYGEMCRKEMIVAGEAIDISVTAGDFSGPMAAWYARKMGLPVYTVICANNENSSFWDLIYHGQMHTDAVASETDTPEADYAVPENLERLISAVLGPEELNRYLDICRRGRLYTVTDEQAVLLREGMFAAVISGKRMSTIISSVSKTHGYLLDPYSALAYGGIQDYRAKTGGARTVLLIADKGPRKSAAVVAKALGLSSQ